MRITIESQRGALADQRPHPLGEHGIVDRLLGGEVGVEGLVTHLDGHRKVAQREAGQSPGPRQPPGSPPWWPHAAACACQMQVLLPLVEPNPRHAIVVKGGISGESE